LLQSGDVCPDKPRIHLAEYVTGLPPLVAEHKAVSGIAPEFVFAHLRDRLASAIVSSEDVE